MSSTTTDRAPEIPRPPRTRALRPDIQGLRMVAVGAVIADHALGWPSGGFVGVDIFFVISGFLITGLLLREHDRTGSISFANFYRRRIKRILPAATLVIVFTVVVSWLLFASSRATSTLWDGVWAFFFAANWNFAAQGTNYFLAGGAVSPLQHYWSLAVEEQFYFAWPWLMLLIFALAGRRAHWNTRVAHRIVGFVMLGIVAASFAWALYDTVNAPTWAYFSTFSRTWELGIGALLAVFGGSAARLSVLARSILGWAGLLGIVASVFLVDSGAGFPAPWAALPVLSTALVIWAGIGGEQRYLWPLTNRFSGYLGDISFSLYLWHFPMIIFASTFFGGGGKRTILAALLATAIFAVASYHFVEDPIRKSRWLDPRAARTSRPTARPVRSRGRTVLIAAGATVAVVALTAVLFLPRSGPAGLAAALTDSAGDADLTAEESVLHDKIQEALAATAWPTLTPEIGEARSAAAPQMSTATGCMHPNDLTDPDVCVYGSGEKTAVLVGDSIAVAWMPAVIEALGDEGYKVRAIGFGSCPFVYTEINLPNRPEETARCNDNREPAAALIQSMDPDLVVMSNNQGGYGAMADRPTGDAASAEWTAAREDAIRAVSAPGRAVVVLAPPPVGKIPAECATKVSVPADCISGVGADWRAMVAADELATAATGATFVSPLNWFCASGFCPIFVDGTPVRTDQLHMTATYGVVVAPVLREALLAAVPAE